MRQHLLRFVFELYAVIETLKCCQHCYKMMPRKTTVFSYQKQKMKIEVIATYKMKLCKMIFEETYSLFFKYNSSSIETKIETKSNISHSTTLANSLGKRRVFLRMLPNLYLLL